MTAFNFNLVRLNQVATLLGGIKSPDFQRRDVFAPLGQDGAIHQTSNAIIRSKPMARFSTVAVRALVALLSGSTELPMVVLDGSNGLELIAAKINASGPGYAGGTVHARRKAITGQLYLAGLKWSPGNVLEAACDAFFYAANGTTDPVVSDTIALPTIPVNTEQLVLTSLIAGAATITKVTDYDVSIAHKCENADEDICFDTGKPFPIMLNEAGVGGNTEISGAFETTDFGAAPTASGTVTAVFTAVSPLGIGTGSPIVTVTATNCIIREVSDASGPGKRRFEFKPTWDNITRPLTCVAG